MKVMKERNLNRIKREEANRSMIKTLHQLNRDFIKDISDEKNINENINETESLDAPNVSDTIDELPSEEGNETQKSQNPGANFKNTPRKASVWKDLMFLLVKSLSRCGSWPGPSK